MKIKDNIQIENVGDYNRVVSDVNQTERSQINEFDGYLEDCIYFEIYMTLIEMALIKRIQDLSEVIVQIKSGKS